MLLALSLTQALGLPVLVGPCQLAECAQDEQGDCLTPCSACLCCAPVRTLPPLGASVVAATVTVTPLLFDRDAIPPDTPPHEILHVPKA